MPLISKHKGGKNGTSWPEELSTLTISFLRPSHINTNYGRTKHFGMGGETLRHVGKN